MGGLAASLASPSRTTTGEREGMRDTREIVVSVVGYLLFVAIAIAIIVAAFTQ